MAGDLIPPPSPAGRPDPDAGRGASDRPSMGGGAPPTGVDDLVLAARPDDGGARPQPHPAGRPSRYRARFGFVTGALLGVALAAVAAAVLIAGRGTPADPAAGWSAWKPTGEDRLVRAAEIAQHVARKYRLNDGSQLVDVQAGPLAMNDVPLTPLVRTAPTGGDIVPIYGDGILFVLNGLGRDGSIAREQPSAARLALVEREAIELALHTFRYVDDVDHVVAMLPPPPPETAAKDAASSAAADEPAPLSEGKPVPAMLFRPGDLRAQLEAPLAMTFPTAPPRPATMGRQDAEAIGRFVQGNLFQASVMPSQTGQGFLLLDRPHLATPAEDALRSLIPGRKRGEEARQGRE